MSSVETCTTMCVCMCANCARVSGNQTPQDAESFKAREPRPGTRRDGEAVQKLRRLPASPSTHRTRETAEGGTNEHGGE